MANAPQDSKAEHIRPAEERLYEPCPYRDLSRQRATHSSVAMTRCMVFTPTSRSPALPSRFSQVRQHQHNPQARSLKKRRRPIDHTQRVYSRSAWSVKDGELPGKGPQAALRGDVSLAADAALDRGERAERSRCHGPSPGSSEARTAAMVCQSCPLRARNPLMRRFAPWGSDASCVPNRL